MFSWFVVGVLGNPVSSSTGKSVLLFTSELREIKLACDRAIVIYEGQVSAELDIDICSEENLMNAAHGIRVTS